MSGVPPFVLIALVAFGVSAVLAALAPAPKRGPRLEVVAFVVLLGGALVVAVSTPVLPVLPPWYGAAAAGVSAWTLVVASLWLARAPGSEDDDGSDGGGGPRAPRDPDAPSTPDGGGFDPDWAIFDSERAAWEQRSRDRDPVGV